MIFDIIFEDTVSFGVTMDSYDTQLVTIKNEIEATQAELAKAEAVLSRRHSNWSDHGHFELDHDKLATQEDRVNLTDCSVRRSNKLVQNALEQRNELIEQVKCINDAIKRAENQAKPGFAISVASGLSILGMMIGFCVGVTSNGKMGLLVGFIFVTAAVLAITYWQSIRYEAAISIKRKSGLEIVKLEAKVKNANNQINEMEVVLERHEQQKKGAEFELSCMHYLGSLKGELVTAKNRCEQLRNRVAALEEQYQFISELEDQRAKELRNRSSRCAQFRGG